MAVPNGAATPPMSSTDIEPTAGTKRKRTHRQGSREGTAPPSRDSLSAREARNASNIADVFEVLSGHEAAPALLNFPIESEDDTHVSKKTKRPESGPSTVSRKVSEGVYSTLEELETDIDSICAAQIASLRELEDEEESKTFKRLSGDDVAQMQDIMSFQSFAKEVIEREKDFSRDLPEELPEKSPRDKGRTLNGIKDEPGSTSPMSSSAAGRTVLSLFGNAPNPRQLFSSLQDETGTDITLQELGLPTMLVATKLLPIPKEEARNQQTIGELFAPPSSLPTLQPPPKQSRVSANRSNSIAFLSHQKTQPKPSRKGPYPLQPLSTGKWLRYGSKMPRKESLREHSRDRTLSVTERWRLGAEEAAVPDERLEEDLFASAYSSFAPTRDDSRAIIPADMCDMVWWQKIGKRKTHDSYYGENRVEQLEVDDEAAEEEARQMEQDREIKMYEELVADFDDEMLDDEEGHQGAEENGEQLDDVEAQALLAEINELLRTLSSHQRIRHSILPPSSRNPTSPSPLRNTMLGTPTEPSVEETSTYRILREHLAILISKLPPYLVAKLNGAQIEDLLVSRTILVQGRNTRGVMEEDQATRTARGVAAAAAAATAASSAATRPSASQQFGQYGRWSGVASNARTALTPQTHQSGSRNSISYGRSTSGLGAATPVQTNRPSYGQTGSYTAPVNRAMLGSQIGYGSATSSQQYAQRQAYLQQAGSQGSPQPSGQARLAQFSSTQAQYQAQARAQAQRMGNVPSYGGQPKGYNSQPMGQSGDMYGARPGSNGRSTPVANIAPAAPMGQMTPFKAPPPPAQHQQQQTNGI
ncbi:hypothetical protein ANO11243_055270 [Dothideomycetidae sp. 11243]|nr:hypothetical protein ANO11243_055270 [fungal sp. No.11243]